MVELGKWDNENGPLTFPHTQTSTQTGDLKLQNSPQNTQGLKTSVHVGPHRHLHVDVSSSSAHSHQCWVASEMLLSSWITCTCNQILVLEEAIKPGRDRTLTCLSLRDRSPREKSTYSEIPTR